jgi:hypothetical protein
LELESECGCLIADQIVFSTQDEIPLRACAAASPEVEAR